MVAYLRFVSSQIRQNQRTEQKIVEIDAENRDQIIPDTIVDKMGKLPTRHGLMRIQRSKSKVATPEPWDIREPKLQAPLFLSEFSVPELQLERKHLQLLVDHDDQGDLQTRP